MNIDNQNKIIPYTPIYCRASNKLVRYEERPFTCGGGNKGIERIAIYEDKNGNEQEMTAQVIWIDLYENMAKMVKGLYHE